MSEELMIIDNDVGTDDAQAVFMALAQTDVRVLALTAVCGNTYVDTVALNCLRVLQAASRLDIPVYRGCTEPLLGIGKDGLVDNGFHGDDALGDVPEPNAPGSSLIREEHAVQALIRLVNQYPGQINLACIGPLTNIAMAVRLDPEFGRKLKQCYIMGGNMTARGNITVSGEFNFACDPEAAYVVLNQLKCPITLATLEICQDCYLEWDWYYGKLVAVDTKIGKFVKKIDAKFAENVKKENSQKYKAWDQLAMAMAVDSRVVIETKHVYVTVELDGSLTRGQVVVDWLNKLKKEPNVFLVTKADKQLYMDILLKAMYGKVKE